MKDPESVTSLLPRCWNQDRLYSTVWTGTLVVVGGLLIASRAYPDGTIDPELMNLWIVWSILLALVNFLTDDLRFIVGIQLLLVMWLTIRIRFNRITLSRFLLVMVVTLLLIGLFMSRSTTTGSFSTTSRVSIPLFLIFVIGFFYLWQHQRFSAHVPVCSIGGQIPLTVRSRSSDTTSEINDRTISDTTSEHYQTESINQGCRYFAR